MTTYLWDRSACSGDAEGGPANFDNRRGFTPVLDFSPPNPIFNTFPFDCVSYKSLNLRRRPLPHDKALSVFVSFRRDFRNDIENLLKRSRSRSTTIQSLGNEIHTEGVRRSARTRTVNRVHQGDEVPFWPNEAPHPITPASPECHWDRAEEAV